MNEIEVIWKFLDNLDEYVYATDIETCLLYTSPSPRD